MIHVAMHACLALVLPSTSGPAALAPRLATARVSSPVMSVESKKFFPTRESVMDASLVDIAKNPSMFKEATREFRRDVYTYADWLWHREAGHVADAFTSVFTSGVSKWLWSEIFFVMVSAFIVLGYNDGLPALADAVRASSPDLASTLDARPLLKLGLLPLTLSSPALFLLLVFRTNASYDRWWEARKVWGAIINTTRDHVRMCLTLMDNDKLREQATAQTASYSRILKFHLREPSKEAEDLLYTEIAPILTPEELDTVMKAKHKPMALSGLMSKTIHKDAENLSTFERLKLDQSLTLMMDYLGMCERIVKTPIPLVYTRHTARFLSWWLVFLPFCLYDALPNHLLVIPVAGMISFFLLGIEDLGNQIEEPFSILPLEVMGDGISGSIFEALEMKTGKPKEMRGVDVVPYNKVSSQPSSFVR